MPFITSQTSKNHLKPQRSPSPDQAKDDPSGKPAVKKERTGSCEDNWIPSRRYWDSLPKHYLTKHALLEVARRYYREHPRVVFQRFEKPVRRSARLKKSKPKKPPSQGKTTRLNRPTPSLKRFARGGGPDLTSICGHPYPVMADESLPFDDFPAETKSKRTKPYDQNYVLAINRAGIFTTTQKDGEGRRIKPDNLQEILKRLNKQLSPSPLDNLTDDDFEEFKEMVAQEVREDNGMPKTMALLAGKNHHNSWNSPDKFTNMAPIDPILAPPLPSAFDGEDPGTEAGLQLMLGKYICPSKRGGRPFLPNLIELRHGNTQSYYDPVEASHAVAMGARAMWMMYNIGTGERVYDNKAYSFLSIMNGQTLVLYAMHLRKPKQNSDKPEYHLTELDSSMLKQNLDSLKRCAQLYRNLRDLAREQRKAAVVHVKDQLVYHHFLQNPPPDFFAAGQPDPTNEGLQNPPNTGPSQQGPSSIPGWGIPNEQGILPPGAQAVDDLFDDIDVDDPALLGGVVPTPGSYAKLSDPAGPVVRNVPARSRSTSEEL